MQKRLTIRLKYVSPYEAQAAGTLGERRYQVLDGSSVIATCDSKEDAIRHIRKVGGRLALRWGRTVIAGETDRYDFEARDGDQSVGRIYKTVVGTDPWFWAMNGFGEGIRRVSIQTSGTVQTKDEAAALVEQVYTRSLHSDER